MSQQSNIPITKIDAVEAGTKTKSHIL